jgi:adenylate kinase family enzyme
MESYIKNNNSMKRIAVIGTSCSGKTLLAQKIAQHLNYPHFELDAIHWLPDWKSRSPSEFRGLINEAVAKECWVIDGNYSTVQDIIWGRATHVIWLNYPFHTVFWRAVRRTVRRVFTREEIFSKNRETFTLAFLSRESILWWVITTFHRRRKKYRSLLTEEKYSNITFIELEKPCDAEKFLNGVTHLKGTVK